MNKCGGGVYPGVQIRRRGCGKALISVGYQEVEKCKVAPAGAPCVTDEESARAEAEERMRWRMGASSEELKDVQHGKSVAMTEGSAGRLVRFCIAILLPREGHHRA